MVTITFFKHKVRSNIIVFVHKEPHIYVVGILELYNPLYHQRSYSVEIDLTSIVHTYIGGRLSYYSKSNIYINHLACYFHQASGSSPAFHPRSCKRLLLYRTLIRRRRDRGCNGHRLIILQHRQDTSQSY